MLRGMV